MPLDVVAQGMVEDLRQRVPLMAVQVLGLSHVTPLVLRRRAKGPRRPSWHLSFLAQAQAGSMVVKLRRRRETRAVMSMFRNRVDAGRRLADLLLASAVIGGGE